MEESKNHPKKVPQKTMPTELLASIKNINLTRLAQTAEFFSIKYWSTVEVKTLQYKIAIYFIIQKAEMTKKKYIYITKLRHSSCN